MLEISRPNRGQRADARTLIFGPLSGERASSIFARPALSATWLLAVIAVTVFVSDVESAPIYGSASRLVAGSAGPNGSPAGNNDTKEAPFGDLSPWSDTATVTYSDTGGSASATASQDSVLDDSGVTMFGSLSATATLGYAGIAQSILNVSFTLLELTPYTSQMMGSPFFFAFANSGSSFAANSSGTLPIGNYGLQIRFQESAGPSPAAIESTYRYSLAFVPESSTYLLAAIGGLLLASCVCWRRRFGLKAVKGAR